MFTLAIVGRPNVGKSTLFNRLSGQRAALVADSPGLTRDRREAEGNIGPLHFRLLDTAGLEEAEAGSLAGRMTAHTLEGVDEADVTLLVVDGRAGITAEDKHFAALLRKTGKPVVLAVNKVENDTVSASALAEAYSLGLGEPIAISAEHGTGLAELYEALAPYEEKLQVASCELQEEDAVQLATRNLQLAIIGRPNAGKSTLVNRLLGKNRMLTGPEAGITRDSIATPFHYKDRELMLIDTAGLRKRARVTEAPEAMAAGDAKRTIRRAAVIVVLMDATLAFEKQDMQLAEMCALEGRAIVMGVNKWDLVPVDQRELYLETCRERADKSLPQLAGIPIIPISAERGKGLDNLMDAVFRMENLWNTRLTTGKLNRWLEEALTRHAPPMINGRRLKIRYMTQVAARPPTFTLFANLTAIPDHYARYLVNSLREAFGLKGVPLRLHIRKGKNPYEEEDE